MTIETDNAAGLLNHTPAQSSASSESEYLTDEAPRHGVWDARKAAADVVAGVYAQADTPAMSQHGRKVLDCSQTLFLLPVFQGETGEISFKVNSWKCRERHCPICQSVRAHKLQQEFSAALPVIMAQVPKGAFLLLTLTVSNCPITELRATLAEMGKAWQRLLRKPEFRIVRGWIRGTEVTKGEDGPMQAHPHFHVLLLVPSYYFAGKSYIKQARWTELWQSVARLNYVPVVDIRRVKTVQGGIEEAVKAATYSIKPAEWETDPAWFHELHQQVSGLRFLATGGVIKAALGAQVGGEADGRAEGAEDPEGEAASPLVFTWRRPEKRYRRKR